MRASEFIIERKKRSKKTRGYGGYFFPGYGFYGGDAGEVGQAMDFLMELRLEQGPIGGEAATKALLEWWASR